MIVLSFDQPHATLIVNRIQTVATFGKVVIPPGDPKRGARFVFDLPSLVGQTVAIAATGVGAFARSPDPNITWPVPVGDLPRSAIVGSARVKAVVPIVKPGNVVGPSILVNPQAGYPGPPDSVWAWQVPTLDPTGDDTGSHIGWHNLTDQLPFADFSPGRIAVIFEDARPCDPPDDTIPYESTGPISEVTL